MKILINGIGNIGRTLISVLNQFKNGLGIDTIYALKNHVQPWSLPELELLQEQGVELLSPQKNQHYRPVEDIIQQIDYIFDCTANGLGRKNKAWYESLTHLKGCSAQGSEKGFGLPFMSGIINHQIALEKFVQIVSCNTHSLASTLQTFTNNDISQLDHADFVVVRRSEDIGNHDKLVSANVVSRHLNPTIGTHHAIDVIDLYQTLNQSLDLTSSDVTTPSQMMHAVRFNIELKKPLTKPIGELIAQQHLVSSTEKFDSNVIFELGRRYGLMGRLYSHAIIVDNNLMITEKNIKGWAFIPQEGNSILSTIHAFLYQTDTATTADEKIKILINALIRPKW